MPTIERIVRDGGHVAGAPLPTLRLRRLVQADALAAWFADVDVSRQNGLHVLEHRIEIVADRGIDARVGREGWEKICLQMEAAFRSGDFERGVIKGVEE